MDWFLTTMIVVWSAIALLGIQRYYLLNKKRRIENELREIQDK